MNTDNFYILSVKISVICVKKTLFIFCHPNLLEYISKIKKNYLYQVILKTPNYKKLHRLLLACDFKPTGEVELIKDINPVIELKTVDIFSLDD